MRRFSSDFRSFDPANHSRAMKAYSPDPVQEYRGEYYEQARELERKRKGGGYAKVVRDPVQDALDCGVPPIKILLKYIYMMIAKAVSVAIVCVTFSKSVLLGLVAVVAVIVAFSPRR